MNDNINITEHLIIIDSRDNVGVAPDGHKRALRPIEKGEPVIKYGYPVGRASEHIKAGDTVHTRNLKTALDATADYIFRPEQLPALTENSPMFMGFSGPAGTGIRNEIWIIPTVGCVNGLARRLEGLYKRVPGSSVDGVYAHCHPYGCSQLGGDHRMTQKILSGLINNPNAGGVLVLGLGCENNNIAEFREFLGGTDPSRVKFLSAQDCEDETEEGLRLLGELDRHAGERRRVPCPLSSLTIGLKCGGSDAFSGITANPLVGRFTDQFIARGGTAVLTEVPEMFGAESILMNRAADRQVFDAIVELINNFKAYFLRHNQTIYENPSPGNKAGGITTLEEKSLGCIRKGGTSAVRGVAAMGERIGGGGLWLADGPGNDIVSCTNLAAAGCQLILFTTGRGTPLGAPVPTVKISSGNALASRKPHWIDLDASDPEADLFGPVLAVAQGKPTKNELNAMREIAIFKDGITL
ncbi:MAG: altronate dehydratase family protein [Eubacteriales bacterium]|nr:altronate dehydratase family protein [Eubacteriales bacterium]